MRKRILAFLTMLVLCLTAVIPVFAEQTEGFADAYYRVVDIAYLLTDEERETLTDKLDEISIRQSMNVVVVTTDSLEGCEVSEFADMAYDELQFGYGDQRDGLLLLISIEDNDWCISTCGYGITAFTDAGIEYIGEQIRPDLSDGNYAAAFEKYADLCDEFITQARSGEPYDSNNLPRESLSLIWIPISLAIGFVLALIVVGVMKSNLKTVRYQAAATDYMKKGSLNITESRDRFLYRTVTRTEKPKNNSSSGSSTHKSASGTTHGGGSGKF